VRAHREIEVKRMLGGDNSADAFVAALGGQPASDAMQAGLPHDARGAIRAVPSGEESGGD
jgi:hypothetical protein